MQDIKVGITATGSFFPERIITNDEFAKRLDTTDEWIRTRTGIGSRHIVTPGTGASDLAVPAIQEMLRERGLTSNDIDLILVATVTPDTIFPSTACRIQHMIGAKNAWGFDLLAACSSFLYAFSAGVRMVASGKSKRCIVVGADIMSSIVDPDDRATAVLFGDGAGCVLLEQVDDHGFIDDLQKIDGSGVDHLYMPAGGSRRPATLETVKNREHFVHQNGREVFKSAVMEMVNVSVGILEKNGIDPKEVKLFVPHQANIRIIESAVKRLGLDSDQVMINIDRRANTTSATIPSCLDEGVRTGRLSKGDLVLMATFGAGYTWGSSLMRWCY